MCDLGAVPAEVPIVLGSNQTLHLQRVADLLQLGSHLVGAGFDAEYL